MNAPKHGITATAIAVLLLGTSSVAVSENATHQEKLRTTLAKQQLYGAHAATTSGYKWGRKAKQISKESWNRQRTASTSVKPFNWERNFQESSATMFSYMYSESLNVNTSAEQAGYKWGIRSNADQAGYKWGIRSNAGQAGYKWGIR